MSSVSKPSRSRIVSYGYTAEFDEAPVERVLEQAQQDGIVTAYDTGRGHLVWFQGPPGATLRKVRARVLSLLGGPIT